MTQLNNKFFTTSIFFASIAFSLSACSGIKTEAKYPTGLDRNQTGGDNNIYGKKESIFGKGGIKLMGGRKDKNKDHDSGIGVNSFLWRATLDTISFMPLASADPFGGVVLTDWYTDSNAPNERVKINAFIMGRELKANGIRIRTFRQELANGVWRDIGVSEETARKLEDTILTRARQMRISHLAEK